MRLLLIGLAAAGACAAEAQQTGAEPPDWLMKIRDCTRRTLPAAERVAACTLAYERGWNSDVKSMALLLRFDAKLEAGDFDGAIADADEADRIVPGNPQFLNGRCWTRAVANRDLELARDACNLSLAREMSAATLDSRALVFMRMGLWEEALTDYDEAFSIDPRLTLSLYGRGLAALALGRVAEGEADMRRAATAAPEFARHGLTPETVKAQVAMQAAQAAALAEVQDAPKN